MGDKSEVLEKALEKQQEQQEEIGILKSKLKSANKTVEEKQKLEKDLKDLEKENLISEENLIGGDLLDYIGDNFNELLKEFINSDMENVEPLDDSFDDLYKAIEERLCND